MFPHRTLHFLLIYLKPFSSNGQLETEGMLYAPIILGHEISVRSLLTNCQTTMTWVTRHQPGWKFYDITLTSYGASDPGYQRRGTKLTVNGLTYSDSAIGFRVLQFYLGQFQSFDVFDTHSSSEEGKNMVQRLRSIKDGTAVLVAVEDEGTWQGFTDDVKEALRSVGGVNIDSLRYRSPYCLIALKRPGIPQTIRENVADAGKGPVVCSASFLLRLSKWLVD